MSQSSREREARLSALLGDIQQQRLDLSAARRDWLDATSRYDHGWLTFLGMRRYMAIGGSVLAVWSVRHPGRIARWARRGFAALSTWRLIRKNLPLR